MAETTGISWTDATFNPWMGCTKVSPACDHCYAETLMRRYGKPHLWQGERQRTSAAYLSNPMRWQREAAATGTRKRVFCASLADVFDNQVPPEWRADLWALIRVTPMLDWQLLTKRPQNIAKMRPDDWGTRGWPNVWLGVTAEDAYHYRQRWPHLAAVPARVRFVSYEPALGPMLPFVAVDSGVAPDWVIAGGESGANCRPSDPAWFRAARQICKEGEIAFFMKQMGGHPNKRDRLEDFPPDLRLRELPAAKNELEVT